MRYYLHILLLLFVSTIALESKGRYVGNLTDVLGDVKQGQIQNRLKTKAQVDRVLEGFYRLGCNGVRITIFADGQNPNPEMYDYLYREAKRRGFRIFANPAQDAGGVRIANKRLEGRGPPVLGSDRAAEILIDRIKRFAREYPCDWICPFNEDARTGSMWSEQQINMIFSKLRRELNGAELIGPCTWGISATIDLFRNTNIENHITVATTHNLGFEHEKWEEFLELARARRLPVWDSEVNHNRKYPDKMTRLEVALKVEVDGLVLYHAWKDLVNRNTGQLTRSGMEVRKMILHSVR